jgi:hypothetical protein
MNTQTNNHVSPGTCLDGLFNAILQANRNLEEKIKAKPDVKHEKHLDKLQYAINDYVQQVIAFIEQRAIQGDYKGIINKTGVPEHCHYMVDKAIKEFDKNHIIDAARLDSEVKAGLINNHDAKGVLANGISYLFDAETGKLVLAYEGVKKICWVTIEHIGKLWTRLSAAIKELIEKVIEKSSELTTRIKGYVSEKKEAIKSRFSKEELPQEAATAS